MVHPYLRRRQGKEPVSYPSPEMEVALSRTLGVPIFQEQVMQVAMLAAGFSAGEADQLRRAMAAWKRKGGLERYYDRIVSGMLERGYERDFAESIFQQIQGFGEYGFPESHAASFALLVYASAWLKCHGPAAFLCALLNSQPMGFYSPSQLVQDAKRHGVIVLPADVAVSGWDSSLEPGDNGPRMRRPPLRQRDGSRAPGIAGPARHAGPSRRRRPSDAGGQSTAGPVAGVRRGAGQGLAQSCRSTRGAASAGPPERRRNDPGRLSLDGADVASASPRPPASAAGQQAVRDRCHAGRLRESAARPRRGHCYGAPTSRYSEGSPVPDDRGRAGNVNVIVWPSVLEKFRKEILNASLLGIYGQWQADGEVRHLVAQYAVDLSPMLGVLDTRSRDFC